MGVIHDYIQYRRKCLGLTYEQIATMCNKQFNKTYNQQKICDIFMGRRTISRDVEKHISFALKVNSDYLRFINGRLPNFEYARYPDEKAVMALLTNWQNVYGAGVFDEESI